MEHSRREKALTQIRWSVSPNLGNKKEGGKNVRRIGLEPPGGEVGKEVEYPTNTPTNTPTPTNTSTTVKSKTSPMVSPAAWSSSDGIPLVARISSDERRQKMKKLKKFKEIVAECRREEVVDGYRKKGQEVKVMPSPDFFGQSGHFEVVIIRKKKPVL